jgi:hypothetical protein
MAGAWNSCAERDEAGPEGPASISSWLTSVRQAHLPAGAATAETVPSPVTV